MTPAARVAATIDILDAIFEGEIAEKAVSSWGRNHRFAGSKDRAAIRDHVFQALRNKTSYAWMGGANTGRGVMLGAMREAGLIDAMFTGEGYAPAAPQDDEIGQTLDTANRAVRLDMPDWMHPKFDETLGDSADSVLDLMKGRAGVFLRVNTTRTDRDTAQAELAKEDIVTALIPNVKTALQVIENERRVANSTAYKSGLVEVQDPSSQQAVAALNLTKGTTVLDYCAGGGGKALALAAAGALVTAHDINPKRTQDIAPRAQRAGAEIDVVLTEDLPNLPLFDVVFCDAPCTGSGTWRRTPEAKWALTGERLTELTEIQADVLENCSKFVKAGGRLVYATCSVFRDENDQQIDQFLTKFPDFSCTEKTLLTPSPVSDGFFFSILHRAG